MLLNKMFPTLAGIALAFGLTSSALAHPPEPKTKSVAMVLQVCPPQNAIALQCQDYTVTLTGNRKSNVQFYTNVPYISGWQYDWHKPSQYQYSYTRTGYEIILHQDTKVNSDDVIVGFDLNATSVLTSTKELQATLGGTPVPAMTSAKTFGTIALKEGQVETLPAGDWSVKARLLRVG